MKNSEIKVRFMAQSAMIAAIYAILTVLAASLNLAYGSVQFRFSEALTILPVFTPAAIPGLTIGCLISNLGSPMGAADWVFGTLASFLAAVFSYYLRNIQIKNIPILSFLSPVLFNALIVGMEIAVFALPEGFSWLGFWTSAISVGAGELVVCMGLGIPLYLALEKSGAIKRVLLR